MKLKELAHSRTGHKGDISNISIMVYNEQDYKLVKERVTPEKVKKYFSDICKGEVISYEIDSIHFLNFILVLKPSLRQTW